ncbi:MAG: response regulator [Verrucomicrobiia bacterium]|jgi:signal transduction histidine kinase
MGIYDALAVSQAEPKKNGKPTLLIVDDEAGPRESLRIVFKDRYQCAVATCGRDGIDYARKNHVDAAILDIKMPDLSGVEVLRELKEIDPNIECIMLTGYETVETARAAVRYGAADYLNKPFDVFFVRELLEKCIARRQRKITMEESLQTLQKVNEELSRGLADSNRAVTANVLSAGVIHEINNPLSIVAGYAQLLSRDLAKLGDVDQGTAQNVQERLATIQREIDRCKEIAKRFLSFSRASQQGSERIEVAKLLEDTVMLVKAHPANRSTEISSRVSDPSLQIKAHPAEVMQVLINLGVNALQAMNGGGTLAFSAERASSIPDTPAFRSDTFDPQKQHLKISVTDSGCGISPENVKKIFEPYFTTKSQGTGLGLAIVCELVGKYGGAIQVQSAPDKGSTFSVYLPLSS